MGQGSGAGPATIGSGTAQRSKRCAARVWTDTARQQAIDELGPWFHNMRLAGLQTAPWRFLGDYPEVKFASFRDALPADLTGKTVLDIGCNAGFESNWWVPNRACTEAMLRSSGVAIESQPKDEVYVCRSKPVEVPPDGSPCVNPHAGVMHPATSKR